MCNLVNYADNPQYTCTRIITVRYKIQNMLWHVSKDVYANKCI